MNTKLATTLIISALLAPVAGYAAEKSMAGVGRDIERGGEKIQDKAAR